MKYQLCWHNWIHRTALHSSSYLQDIRTKVMPPFLLSEVQHKTFYKFMSLWLANQIYLIVREEKKKKRQSKIL